MRLLLALLLAGAAVAHAARPFVTDDARIVDKGGCQVETFVKRRQRFKETEFWVVPACNPWGIAELSAGHIRVDSINGDTRTTSLQAKTLLKPLETNGTGFALSLGVLSGAATSPYVNGIGSFSFADDRVVVHANLGAIRDNVSKISRGTWGIGAEVLLIAPRLYGIAESYGQRGEKPTLHGGLRYWVVPDRVQVDATLGAQNSGPPARRFHSVGLRILF
jgi:hypothetical protein